MKDLDKLAQRIESNVKPKVVGYGLTVLNKTIQGLQELKKAVEQIEHDGKRE